MKMKFRNFSTEKIKKESKTFDMNTELNKDKKRKNINTFFVLKEISGFQKININSPFQSNFNLPVDFFD